MDFNVAQLVDSALTRRSALATATDTDAWRVIHGAGDGVPGLVVERLGSVLVAQLHEGHLGVSEERVLQLLKQLQQRLGTQAIYKKLFVRDRDRVPAAVEAMHRDAEPWWGQPVEAEITVREHGLRYQVRPYAGFATGLYLEHRGARQRVRALAQGRRVLNLFCYAGGFSVAAAAGGAVHVSSVDLAKNALEWGKHNFTANGLDLAEHRFFCSDVLDFYRRAERQGRRYDLVVLDPPTFSRGGRAGGAFVLEKRLEDLLAGAVKLLDPGGWLLLAVHQRDLPAARLTQAWEAAAGHRAGTLEQLELGIDFPGDPDYAKSLLGQLLG